VRVTSHPQPVIDQVRTRFWDSKSNDVIRQYLELDEGTQLTYFRISVFVDPRLERAKFAICSNISVCGGGQR